VAGHVVLQWYLTGRHISVQKIRQLYIQAFARGKNLAKSFVERLPGSRSGKETRLPALAKNKKLRAGRCTICGGKNPRKAQYCQHCGHVLDQG
jgi:ribosomal protein L40E